MTPDTAIHVDAFLAHPPAKVWRALTETELLAKWLRPQDFQPVVGHRFTIQAKPVEQTGFSGLVACEVLDVEPESLLRISWTDAARPELEPTTVTWRIEPEGRGTRLFLTHEGFAADDPRAQLARTIMDGGWRTGVLTALRAALDGEPVPRPA